MGLLYIVNRFCFHFHFYLLYSLNSVTVQSVSVTLTLKLISGYVLFINYESKRSGSLFLLLPKPVVWVFKAVEVRRYVSQLDASLQTLTPTRLSKARVYTNSTARQAILLTRLLHCGEGQERRVVGVCHRLVW
jgi:hypothetical protein